MKRFQLLAAVYLSMSTGCAVVGDEEVADDDNGGQPADPVDEQADAFVAPAAIPAGYTAKKATAYGVVCDGTTDTTTALQKALSSLQSYQALQLPAGTCVVSTNPLVSHKTHVAVIGTGMGTTILRASDPAHSAFTVGDSSDVLLSGFTVKANTTGVKRTGLPQADGVFVRASSTVTVDGVRVQTVAAAGILFSGVNGGTVKNSIDDHSLADAFHFTNYSRNIVVQNNRAIAPGDDCFASIGHAEYPNRNINFFDNTCSDGPWGGGVSFEGTIGGKAYRNKIYRVGVSCFRADSDSNWNTGPTNDIDFQDNYGEGCVQRTVTGHGAIMLWTNYQPIGPNVTFARTTIVSPATHLGVKAAGSNTVHATLTDTVMSGVSKPFYIYGTHATLTHTNTTVDGSVID